MCSTKEETKMGGEAGPPAVKTFAPGVTLDDFWKLGKKPYLTKEGIYKKVGQDDIDRNLRAGFADEENEDKLKVPRRVIPNNEVDRFIESFWPKSELNRDETRKLIEMFFEYAKRKNNPGYMTKGRFKQFIFGTLDLYDPFICERMFLIFDSNQDGFIDYVEWTHGMHTVLVGSIHEQLKYCFRIYDVKTRNCLDKDDIYFWIKRSYFNLSPMTDVQRAEFYEDIYKLVLDKFVGGEDNRVTFRQYRTAVCDRPSLMETIGTVLPETEAIWKLNDILFSRFYRSKYLMLFPRGDVPKNRDIKFDPAQLMDRFAPADICYPPNYIKGPDGKPVLKNAPPPPEPVKDDKAKDGEKGHDGEEKDEKGEKGKKDEKDKPAEKKK